MTATHEHDGDIEQITQMIWEALFDIPIQRDDSIQLGRDSTVTAIIHLDGAWHGAVVLRTSMRLAVRLTASMFGAEGTPTPAEVKDGLGEIANMVAGNLKALLPQPCSISLPAVAFGSDYEIGVIGTIVTSSVTFCSEDEPLNVTLLRKLVAEDGS